MSRDLTPKEYLALEQHNIKNGFGSIFDFMHSTTMTYNGETVPFHTEEEMAHREAFPLLGKLLNNFEDLYMNLAKIHGGLDFLSHKDTELSLYIETGKGAPDSLLIRWFEGNLDDGFYQDKTNEQHFLNVLPAEAALSHESDSISQLAHDLDKFAYDQDYYEYGDQVEDSTSHISEIERQLISGNVMSLTDYLISFIEETEPSDPIRDEALKLAARIDKVVSLSLEKFADQQLTQSREAKGVHWFALDEDKCISVWYAPDKQDGDQFQMHLEQRKEDGSMGAGCEVLSDESYATADISHASLVATLQEIYADAGIPADEQVKHLAESIFSVFEIRSPGLDSLISAAEQKLRSVSSSKNTRDNPER